MGKYDKILNKPHHISKVHPQMSMSDRAAQFAPFAALTGYDDMVRETARVVEEKIRLDEDALQELNQKTLFLREHLKDEPVVAITYFVPDSRKKGGKYETKEGVIKKYDEFNQVFVFTDGTTINLLEVLAIESDAFPEW